jgi:hypothetical protein
MLHRDAYSGYADFYQAVCRLLSTLREAGEAARHVRIEETLYGTTAGEIFPPLRQALQVLRTSDVAARLGLADQLDPLIQALERSLTRYEQR